MDEFGLIAKYLAPLAGRGALGLTDDAALLPGRVIATDILVDGVHFRREDGLQYAAKKAVRANLSDITAMGARAEGMLLGVVWPEETTEADVAAFTAGLAEDLTAFGIALLGGDTTRGRERLTISITMTGVPHGGRPVRRSGARGGDLVAHTGLIGEGWLGLQAIEKGWTDCPQAVRHYLAPTVPDVAAPILARHASAAIDVSDGLVADSRHLASTSGVGFRLSQSDIRHSAEAVRRIASEADPSAFRRALLTGGDDYQLLFTFSEHRRDAILGSMEEANVPCTVIGHVEEAGPAPVRIVSDTGEIVPFKGRSGFSHF